MEANTHLHLEAAANFCPKCGGRLAPRKPEMDTKERLTCQSCDYIFYLDPKVAACTITQLDGKVVLLKRDIEPAKGKWVFPGGFVDRGEDVRKAAARETKEEVNLEVSIGPLLNVYSYEGFEVIVVVFLAEIEGGELKAGVEAKEVGLFGPEEIPWDQLAFKSTRQALEDWVKLSLRGDPAGRP